MNKLFVKILVSFWLALILFAGLTLWITSQYLENTRNESDQANPRVKLADYILQAQRAYQANGQPGLETWLRALDNRDAIPYLLIDQNGKDLINRPVPLSLQQRIRQYEFRYDEHGAHEKHEKYNRQRPHRQPIMVNGKRYRLLPDYQNVTLSRLLNRPRLMIVPILVASLVSGIVGFLLARYLTAPIRRLRLATRHLAQGNLDQRVLPSMGKRKDEMSDLASDFDYMAEQLEKLLTSHKQLLRDASHELRSPLARLQVALGLARQSCTKKELDRIELETERLNEIIGQLLSLTRLDGQFHKIKQESINLNELILALAADANFEASSLNRHVKFNSDISAIINGDSVLLSSAFENIIRNAIHYTKENTRVDISLYKDSQHQDHVKVTIRDHGPGIPEEMLMHVFEPFVRISEARDRHSGGYGLGLAIASRAIQLHKGKITANNEIDGGMSIHITLPTARFEQIQAAD